MVYKIWNKTIIQGLAAALILFGGATTASAIAVPIISIDLDPGTAGIQSTLTVAPGSSFTIDMVLTGDGVTLFDTFAFAADFNDLGPILGLVLAGVALLGLGAVAPASFMAHFTVFVLACFVGYMVIWNVSAALHTPLMSVTNAISSIIIIGALIQVSSDNEVLKWVAVATVFITSINIVGGFAVTRRMLEMFRR